MNRPTSSKNKTNSFWGYPNQQQHQESYNKQTDHRKKIRLMKPDLTTSDFSRILPRKMYKDKERLYSEGLQLKQAFNQISAENTRLKTQLTMLEKQKYRISRLTQSGEGTKGHQRESHNKNYDAEVKAAKGYKRMIRQLRQQNLELEAQNKKIKKTVKYVKLNELQIELKLVIDENKKLASIIEDYANRLNEQERLETDNDDLQTALEKEYQNNKKLAEENSRLSQEIEEYENQFKLEMDKWKSKENRLTRQLNLHKRKAMQSQRHIDDLRRELKSLMDAKQGQNKKRPSKSAHRSVGPAISVHHPQGHQSRLSDISKQKHFQQEQMIKSFTETENLRKQIQSLRNELEFTRKELSKQRQSKVDNSPKTLEQFSDAKINLERLHVSGPKHSPQVQSEVNIEATYDDEFEEAEELKASRKQKQEEQNIKKLKEQFDQCSEEQSLYKKDGKKKKKKNGEKSNRNKSQSSPGGYKPNKAILTQIKQLLTYRMKSQRYPFSDLKADIEVSQQPAFRYFQLMQMLSNEPFYLKKEYAEAFLEYCFEKQGIQLEERLENKILIEKLRKVIEDFVLMSEEQQKQMIIRIAEMTSSYPQQLQQAFENIKNGQQTVSKKNMIEMFKKLELEDEYIDLIIAQLSLCSDDLEHLNYIGFFQRFYIGDEEYEQDTIEEIREQEEESHQNSSRVKQDKKQRQSKRSGLRM